MQETQNIQHAEKEALPYEAPRMTTVPIRATGAMLVGSMLGTSYMDMEMEAQLWQFENTTADNFASSYDDGWEYTF